MKYPRILNAWLGTSVASALAFTTSSALAVNASWMLTAGGTWNTGSNWTDDFAPVNASDTATVNTDFAANGALALTSGVTVGELNIGDLSGAQTIVIGSIGGNTFTFDNGTSDAQLNGLGAGTSGITFNAPTSIAGNSRLSINTATQEILFKAFSGTGTITKTGLSNVMVDGGWSFTGTINVQQGSFGSNPSNGRLTGVTQINISNTGQYIVSPSNSAFAIANFPTPSSSRINPTATVQMDGGKLSYNGNFGNATLNTFIQESGPTVNFHSGTAEFNLGASNGFGPNYQYALNFSGIQRVVGTTAQLKIFGGGGTAGVIGSNLYTATGGVATVGDVGASNSSTAPIVPWMFAGSLNVNATDFVTYSATRGFELTSAYNTDVNAASAFENVNAASSSLDASKSINAMKISSASATLNLGGNSLSVTSGALLFANTAAISNGTLNLSSTNEGIVYVSASSVGGSVPYTGTISAAITGSNGLTKGGMGNLVLSGLNTYTGDTHIGGGMLQMGAANSLYNGLPSSSLGTVNLSNTVTLRNRSSGTAEAYFATQWDLNGFDQRVGALSGGGSVGGNVALGAATLTLGATSGTKTYDGVISGGGGLTKTGGSTQVLGGANLYAGATAVNGGKLVVNGSLSASSAISVGIGGTLGGSGSVGQVTLASGGTIAPGNSIESLNSANEIWNGGANLELELKTDGTGIAGTDWDLLSIAGTLDLSAVTSGNKFNIKLFTMTNTTTPGSLGAWDGSVNHTWSGFVTTTAGFGGTFTGSDQFFVNPAGFQNAVSGTFSVVQNGNNLDLNYVVPEPSTAIILVGSLALLAGIRRRS